MNNVAVGPQRRIDLIDQKIFDGRVGDPEKIQKEIEITTIAMKSLSQRSWWAAGGSVISASCIYISPFFAPITALVALYAIKMLFNCMDAENKLIGLNQTFKNSFRLALNHPPELSVPFFQKFGYLAKELSFPINTVPYVTQEEYLQWLLLQVKSEQLKSIITSKLRTVGLQKMPLVAEAIMIAVKSIDERISILELPAGDDEKVDHFEQRKKRLEVTLKNNIKDFEEALKRIRFPQDANYIQLFEMAQIIKACPNKVGPVDFSACLSNEGERAVANLIQGKEWQGQLFSTI